MRKVLATIVLFLGVLFATHPVHANDFLTNPSSIQFIWIGDPENQFSNEEYGYIATHFSYVILAKFHANWNIDLHHEAAAELKKRNPNIKIFPYYSAKFWFTSFQFAHDQFKEEWYLHDQNGEKIPQNYDGYSGYYTDVNNPEYRAWAIAVVDRWMSKTTSDGKPLYDGIFFDSATIYPKDIDPDRTLFEGLKDLLQETKAHIGNRLLIGNGITDTIRSLALFESGDISVNENFCYDRTTGSWKTQGQIIQDINLMLNPDFSGKKLFEKVGIKKISGDDVNPSERARYQRFSFGSFLLGHQPGHTFYKYGEAGSEKDEFLYAPKGEIENGEDVDVNPTLTQLNIGSPLHTYLLEPQGVYSRQYRKGWVYVNMSDVAHPAKFKETLILMKGIGEDKRVNPGDSLSVPAHDALFLLQPSDAPTLSGLSDVTTDVNVSPPRMSFTVGNPTGSAGALTVSASSSNPLLVADSGIVLGGSGANRTLQLTLLPNQSGKATITITVSNDTATSVDSFELSVKPDYPPTLSRIKDQSTPEETPRTITFTIGDAETPLNELELSATSSNPTLLPNENMTFGGSDASRTLTVTPAPLQEGTTTITVVVKDALASANTSFTLTVTHKNHAPAAEDDALSLSEDGSIGGTLKASDADGDALTFRVIRNGTKGKARITNAATGAFTYTPRANAWGQDSFTFRVTDGHTHSNTATISVTIASINDPPAIGAIPDQTLLEDASKTVWFTVGDVDTPVEKLTLSGSSSNTALIANANIVLGGTGASRKVTLTPFLYKAGTALITLSVSDGTSSAITTFKLTIIPVNHAPEAGVMALTAKEDTPKQAQLQGTDVDGDPLTFKIVKPPVKGTLQLLNASAGTFIYTPKPDYNGGDWFSYVVNDGKIDSKAAVVALTIDPVNDPPTADAGPDQTVKEGAVVTLSGTNSKDIENDPLTFKWVQTKGTPVALSDATAVKPTFVAPNVSQNGSTLAFRLTVTDTSGATASDVCFVNVTWVNGPPTADAGPNQTVPEGSLVTLNGTNSTDSDDGIASYKWTQILGAPIEFNGPTSSKASFKAPNVGPEGRALGFRLTVTDKGGLSAKDECTVNITSVNAPPVANAGPDQTAKEGRTVTLNGVRSLDGDGSIAAYRWTQIKGTPVTLSDPASSHPTFTAPAVDPDGSSLTFRLTVTDDGGLTAQDTCIVNVIWVNTPPQANAGPSQTVYEGATVTLDASKSLDDDDGIASYLWTQISGTPVTLSDPTSDRPTFVAPSAGPTGTKTLGFRLTVMDHGGLSTKSQCVVTIKTRD